MGLKEKQALANLDFSFAEKTLKEYTGNEIKITLDQESFESDMDAIMYADQRGAQAIANGISKLCYNQIGKDAFNEKQVKKIVIKNTGTEKGSVEFVNGTLQFNTPINTSDWLSDAEVKDLIENQL